MQFNSTEALQTEIELIEQRFALTLPTFAELLGTEKRAREFQSSYLAALREPGSVLFYNKFVVSGRKPGLKAV